MFDFIKKHIGWIVIVILLIIIIAPRLFTIPSLCECLDFSETGQIGDTIGGITSPFIGILSVILLYLTLKEQIQFNKTQQIASDYDLLIKLRDKISDLSNNLQINVKHRHQENLLYQGSSSINYLRCSIYPDNSIDENSFDNLYKGSIEIAELCLSFYDILLHSIVEQNIKRSFFHAVSIHSQHICHLFNMYSNREIQINMTVATIEDDIWSRYAKMSSTYIDRFNKLYPQLQGL